MAEVDCVTLPSQERSFVNKASNTIALNDSLNILLIIKAFECELKLFVLANLPLDECGLFETAAEAAAYGSEG